jgi:tetratricopeptide (TPR) repeat protein
VELLLVDGMGCEPARRYDGGTAVGAADRQTTALTSLIRLYTSLGAVAQARADLEQLDELIATGVVQYNAAQWELVRALFAERMGDAVQALAAAERIMAEPGRPASADALVLVGRAHERAERWEEAAAAHSEALACYEMLGREPLTAEPRAGLARVALARGEADAALTQVKHVLVILAGHPWAGLDDPYALYHTC